MITTLMTSVMVLSLYNPYWVYIEKYSTKYNLNSKIVYYLCLKENAKWNTKKVNEFQAVGVMQVRPIAFREWLRVEKKTNFSTNFISDKQIIKYLKKPSVNFRVGCFYLRHMLNKYNYNYVVALSRYNQGCKTKKLNFDYANEILMNAVR